jgi:hypothetical protein
MIGKKFSISGMLIEILSEEDARWQARNITTKETVFIDKSVLNNAIKLGKAEEIVELDENGQTI